MKFHFINRSVLANALIISSLTLFTFSSCSKDEILNNEINNSEENSNSNYYVKYVISSSYPYIFSNWSVTTPDGTYSKNDYQTRRWEQTYGPIKKGFRCSVKVERGTSTAEIYVSKNQEPFALKNTGANGASYTIDF